MRHILGISGGKDSAALAVMLHKEIPELEYIFCDTKKELPETYDFLDRLEARLGHPDELPLEEVFLELEHQLGGEGVLPLPGM